MSVIDNYEIHRLQEELRKRDELYNELIMAVVSKYEGETRHQTALRYIQETENRTGGPCKADAILKGGKG